MKPRASARERAAIRDARDREIAAWLDGWADKAEAQRFEGRAVGTVRALASSVRAGLAEAGPA